LHLSRWLASKTGPLTQAERDNVLNGVRFKDTDEEAEPVARKGEKKL